MTQSGQGEEHSQRVAREGIVLPSDGGEPLLPGMTGEAATARFPSRRRSRTRTRIRPVVRPGGSHGART